MIDKDAIIECLRALFVERFHIEIPSADTDLLATGALDSLQLVELLLQLEQRFGFRMAIDDIDLDDLRSLARIAQLVSASIDAAARPSRRVAEQCAAARDAPESRPGSAQLSALDARARINSITPPLTGSPSSPIGAEWADSAVNDRK